ncbi:hypothetical protein SDC9_147585 [bioreactor metagenome]|uniref:Uncharacterized protein n=1 Tax=bioreactor metagenome TaxID=1076179 RepID=A0A645EER8_9ZZZZ
MLQIIVQHPAAKIVAQAAGFDRHGNLVRQTEPLDADIGFPQRDVQAAGRPLIRLQRSAEQHPGLGRFAALSHILREAGDMKQRLNHLLACHKRSLALDAVNIALELQLTDRLADGHAAGVISQAHIPLGRQALPRLKGSLRDPAQHVVSYKLVCRKLFFLCHALPFRAARVRPERAFSVCVNTNLYIPL